MHYEATSLVYMFIKIWIVEHMISNILAKVCFNLADESELWISIYFYCYMPEFTNKFSQTHSGNSSRLSLYVHITQLIHA